MDLEKLQQEILDLREKNKELSTELENIKNDNELKSERIKSLEEHNQKLFLRATSSSSKMEEEKQVDNIATDILGDYAKLLSDEEIEQLNEIMEEI